MNNESITKKIEDHEERLLKLEKMMHGSTSPEIARPQKQLSPKEFLLEKKASGEVQKTLLLCYYLERTLGLTSFNLDDLSKVYKLAKEVIPGNLNDKINKNIDKGYLVEAAEKKDTKKAWRLTLSGENFISQINKE